MAINRFMRAALKALSYPDIDLKKNYKVDRIFTDITHPSIKLLYKMWDHIIITDDGYELKVRSFSPRHVKVNEVLLFFHGGGWVSGNIESYTKTCAVMAEQTGRRVFSVDYRLAPEYPFPFAVEDCYRVAKELFLNHTLINTDPDNIVLIGDSAGGNIAAAVSLMAAERREFCVKRQILIYPPTYNDHSEASPFTSIAENGTDYLLTSKKICDYMSLYAPNKSDLQNPYLAPLLSDNLYNQPKTLIITAEYDPLRDEGEAYGEKLKQFGNDARIYRIKDALHGFFSLPLRFAHVKQCYKIVNAFLDEVDE